jgi:hypothetical protein
MARSASVSPFLTEEDCVESGAAGLLVVMIGNFTISRNHALVLPHYGQAHSIGASKAKPPGADHEVT